MDVSVVIPLFNGEDHVRETIESVMDQTLRPAAILTVDDGSTDASPSIAQEYSGVQLLHNPEDGSNAARNYGFRNTDTDAVAFCDHDDLWHPEHLECLSRLLRKYPSSPAAFASKTTFHDSQLPEYSTESSGAKQYDPWRDFPKNTLGEPALALIRSSALRSAGGWSSMYEGCSDYHLWLKLALQGPVVVSESITAGHRIHENSYSGILRRRRVTEYYARHVNASEDAIEKRQEKGLSTQEYESLLEAQRATKQLLEFLLGKDCRVAGAARKIDASFARTSRESLTQMWDVLRWYSGPHMEEVGMHRFAARVLDMVDRWPNADSRFRSLLRDWAVQRTPARDLIRRYPWSPSCWTQLVRRGYHKMNT